jgi:hypothetical protein
MRSRKLAYLLFPVAAIIVAGAARGDILAQYSFTDVVAAQLNRDATTVAPNVTAGSITDAPIVFTHPMVVLSRATGVGYATEPVLAAARAPWNESFIRDNVYFTFSVAANAGYELDLSSVTFNVARGGAATPRDYDIRTSLDGFATSVTGIVEILTQRPTFTPVTIDLSDASFQNLSSPLTFQFRFFTPGFSQNVDFDDITVNGLVAAVPGTTGDYNGNGVVDGADYVVWRKNDGGNTALLNDNGLGIPIRPAHYELWRANFGKSLSGSGTAFLASAGSVPEPAAHLLPSMALVIVSLIRRR